MQINLGLCKVSLSLVMSGLLCHCQVMVKAFQEGLGTDRDTLCLASLDVVTGSKLHLKFNLRYILYD